MASQTFTDARQLFEAAREAVREMERTRRMLEAMEAAEQSGGSTLGAKVAAGSVSDPMRRVDARLDREAVWERRIEEDARLMDYACCLLYGAEQDGRGGVAALMGSLWADVIWWRYLGDATWAKAGEVVGYSRTRCKELAAEAMDALDAYGAERMLGGRGFAEE